MSCFLQKDKKALTYETKRFIINVTLGLGCLIDSAYKIFNFEFYDENIKQALKKEVKIR